MAGTRQEFVEGAEVGQAEVLYTSARVPNPSSALDVLAFVLTPVAAFVKSSEEHEAIKALLDSAKQEAVDRWIASRAPEVS